jgi:uncharacterized protein YkwD
MRLILTIVITLILLLPLVRCTAAEELESGEQAVIDQLNKERAKRKLPQLEVDQELVEGCRVWSNTLRTSKPRVARVGIFGYRTTRIWHASSAERKGCAECVAFNNRLDRDAYRQWLNSDGHRAIMLKRNIKHIGVGRSAGYWTLRVK